MARFDTPVIDSAVTYRINIEDIRKNLNALDDDRVAHENDAQAHGIDVVKSDLSDLESEITTARNNFTDLDSRLDSTEGDLDSLETEVSQARGTKSALNDRLQNGLNADGSLRIGSIASIFQDPKWSVEYVDSTTFKVKNQDVTSQLQSGMLLRFTVDGSYKFGIITSTSFGGSDTTVNIRSQDDVLTSNLTKAEIALVAYQDFASSISKNSSDITKLQGQLNWSSLKSSDFDVSTPSSNQIDTSGNTVTAKMPSSPATGDSAKFTDATASFSSNNFTVDGNGNNVEGSATVTYSTDKLSFELIYNGTQWVQRFTVTG